MNDKRTADSKRPSRLTWLLIIFLLLILIAAVGLFRSLSKSENTQSADAQETTASEASTEESETVEKLTDTIAMPGYSWLNLIADTTEQELTLPNPPQNFCQMRMSLILADGTVLWTSGLVQPGEESDPIVLSTPLAHGEYLDTTLKYECFTIDEAMTPLNGGEITLSLRVY